MCAGLIKVANISFHFITTNDNLKKKEHQKPLTIASLLSVKLFK